MRRAKNLFACHNAVPHRVLGGPIANLKHQDALPSDSNILESDFLTLSCFFMQSS
jgi:hypothetical protein